jgi:iron complex transport system substrate-binding protein
MKKTTVFIMAILLLVSILSGCAGSNTAAPTPAVAADAPAEATAEATPEASAAVLKDREGNEFTLPAKVDRIMSTSPAATEILVGLGLADKIVAVDTYGSDIKGLKSDVAKFDAMNPDAESILALKPDIIIVSSMSKTGGSQDPFKPLKDAGIVIAYMPTSSSFDANYEDIAFLSQVTGTADKGQEMIDSIMH